LARDSQIAERVQFTGRIAGAQFEAVLAKASAVVVPSLGGEVFGLVVAENMLRGLAVVVSDIGSLAEVLGDSGLTFRTGDAEDLSSVLARLLDDPSLAATLGYRARQRALLFYSLDRMIHSHTLLYSQLCSLKNL
jgi:glycosyltransferase involved in cell wall biosynthesis